jgi:hypothetical protein
LAGVWIVGADAVEQAAKPGGKVRSFTKQVWSLELFPTD